VGGWGGWARNQVFRVRSAKIYSDGTGIGAPRHRHWRPARTLSAPDTARDTTRTPWRGDGHRVSIWVAVTILRAREVETRIVNNFFFGELPKLDCGE